MFHSPGPRRLVCAGWILSRHRNNCWHLWVFRDFYWSISYDSRSSLSVAFPLSSSNFPPSVSDSSLNIFLFIFISFSLYCVNYDCCSLQWVLQYNGSKLKVLSSESPTCLYNYNITFTITFSKLLNIVQNSFLPHLLPLWRSVGFILYHIFALIHFALFTFSSFSH